MKLDSLYRGKLKHSNEWIKGNLIIAENSCKYIIPSKSIEPDGHHLIIEDRAFWVISETVGQWSGLTDDDGVNIFEDDLRIDSRGNIFRIYSAPGGFVMKASIWRDNVKDLQWDDELIFEPLADVQTASYICQSTKHYGNIHDIK